MNNQIDPRQLEIISSRVEQLREQSPWMAPYEIEALVCSEFGLTDFDSTKVKKKEQPVAPVQEQDPAAAAIPQEELRIQERLLENYSEIMPDTIGKYGAYDGVYRGAAGRKDNATRALYDLVKAAENDQGASAVIEKARRTISDNLRRESNRVGVTLIISLLVQAAISVLIVVFTVLVMGWNLDEVYNFVTEPTSMALLHAGLLLLAFGFPFIAYLYVHKLPIGEIVPLRKLRKGELVPTVGVGLAVMMVIGTVENYVNYPGALRGANYSFDTISFGNGAKDMLLTLVCMGIIPALIETFVFNGVILQVMRRRGGDGFALVFTALIYAIMTTNFTEMPGAFISALITGYMVIFSGSLVPGVVTRLIERLLFFAVTQLGFYLPDANAVQYIDCGITILLIGFGIVSFFLLLQRFPEAFITKKADPCLTTTQKLKISVTRVPVLILILVCICFSVVQFFDLTQILTTMSGFFNG